MIHENIRQNGCRIFGAPQKERKCFECNADLKEETRFRHTSDYCLVEVVHVQSVATPNQYRRVHRPITVKLVDDLCDTDLVLGSEYAVVGNYDAFSRIFVAWHFASIEQEAF